MDNLTQRESILLSRGAVIRQTGRYGDTAYTIDFLPDLGKYIFEPKLNSREEAIAFGEGVIELWDALRKEYERKQAAAQAQAAAQTGAAATPPSPA